MSEPITEIEVTETIPFYPKLNSIPRTKKAPRAMRLLREWAVRHFKIAPENVLVDQDLNAEIWNRGIEKPPRRVSVRAVKTSDGVVSLYSLRKDSAVTATPVPATGRPAPKETSDEEDDQEEEIA